LFGLFFTAPLPLSENSTALGRAGAMAEFTSNNSMMQRLLRFIIREREHRIGHDAKDSFPIIEKFSC